MTRWKGSNGEVKNIGEKDLTGTSFNDRCKTNTRDLDDMIRYLEYGKNTGYQAVRVDQEQEKYWATLMRNLLMEKNIDKIYPFFSEDKSFMNGIRFKLKKCNCLSSLFKEKDDYKLDADDCNHIYERYDDIKEYLIFLIENYNKEKRLEIIKSDII